VQIRESHQSAAVDEKQVAARIIAGATHASHATEALKRGPVGALLLSAIGVGLLLIGWMLFYFLLFLGRGPVG